MTPTVREILDQFENTIFYPYAFCEELLDREQELLNKIEELKANKISEETKVIRKKNKPYNETITF